MPVVRPADDQLNDEAQFAVRVHGPIVITGGASGIGLATARLLANAGASVAVIDRATDRLDATVAELQSGGTRVHGARCDVSDEAGLEAAFAECERALGPVRGLVCAAGIDRGGDAHTLPVATWDEVISTNLRGTFLACRAAARSMLEHGGGAIVCVSSPFALSAAPGGIGGYAASKAGIAALARSLAIDYARRAIRVNTVIPGSTETPLMWANVAPDQIDATRAVIADEVPLGRLADPEEPARAIAWLLSDDASYVTGSQLVCDGGLLAKAAASA